MPGFSRLRYVLDFWRVAYSYFGYANSFSDGSYRPPNSVARFP